MLAGLVIPDLFGEGIVDPRESFYAHLAQRYILCYGICYGFWQHESTRFSSISLVKKAFAPLAQLAEQVTLNHWVAGSIPARCTFLQVLDCPGPRRFTLL
jgi:hypothetical protein